MKYSINGISTPFGGLSWDRNLCEKDRIIFLFTYLESKRILYNPAEMEIKEWCTQSVLEIKNSLVEITKDIEMNDITLNYISNMVDVCNGFLDSVSQGDKHRIIYKNGTSEVELSFYQAMNTFRDGMKIIIEAFEKIFCIKFKKELPRAW